MDTVDVERSYGDVDDYHPSRGNSLGIGLEPSTLISILAFLAFLLHALLILLIPTLKTFFGGPLFGHGYANNNGIGFGGGGLGQGGFGGGPGIGGGFGGGGFGGGGGGGGYGGGFGGYGAVPSILTGVNGILGTGLLGTTSLLGTGLSGLFGPGVAGISTAPVAPVAGTPITTVTRVRMMQSDDEQNVKPATEVVGESTGRKINTNKLLSKCNFYFCLPGKMKLDRISIGMTRMKIKRK